MRSTCSIARNPFTIDRYLSRSVSANGQSKTMKKVGLGEERPKLDLVLSPGASSVPNNSGPTYAGASRVTVVSKASTSAISSITD